MRQYRNKAYHKDWWWWSAYQPKFTLPLLPATASILLETYQTGTGCRHMMVVPIYQFPKVEFYINQNGLHIKKRSTTKFIQSNPVLQSSVPNTTHLHIHGWHSKIVTLSLQLSIPYNFHSATAAATATASDLCIYKQVLFRKVTNLTNNTWNIWHGTRWKCLFHNM